MSEMRQLPRTWFSKASCRETLYIRRLDRPDADPIFELYGYSGDFAEAPKLLELPDDAARDLAAQRLRHRFEAEHPKG